MKIQQMKICDLKAFKNNPRKNDHAVEDAAKAIEQFGFRVPVLVSSKKEVIDGHLRLKAAVRLGMEKVPCVVADDMTDEQIKAFRISVNRVAELAEWDVDKLQVELDDLAAGGFDISLFDFPDDLFPLEDGEEGEISLKKLELKPPPETAWCLIRIPLHKYGLIQDQLEKMAELDGIWLETITT